MLTKRLITFFIYNFYEDLKHLRQCYEFYINAPTIQAIHLDKIEAKQFFLPRIDSQTFLSSLFITNKQECISEKQKKKYSEAAVAERGCGKEISYSLSQLTVPRKENMAEKKGRRGMKKKIVLMLLDSK